MLNIGDVVMLKSGGPKMTYAAMADDNYSCWCVWFSGTTLSKERFLPDTLKKVESTGTPPMLRIPKGL